jgi:hypothetical protein
VVKPDGNVPELRKCPRCRDKTLFKLNESWLPGEHCASRSSHVRGPSARAVAEEVLDLGEEARRFRLGGAGRQFFELGEQFLLLLGQILRRLHHDLDIHVAGLARA